MSPELLAEWLQRAGLSSAGVIKIQACDAGAGNYLEALKDELTKRGIDVGYLCGPKGSLSDVRMPVVVGNKMYAVNPIRPLAALLPVPYGALLVANKVVSNFKPEPLALKVVKGNIDVAFPGTRYSTPIRSACRVDRTASSSFNGCSHSSRRIKTSTPSFTVEHGGLQHDVMPAERSCLFQSRSMRWEP